MAARRTIGTMLLLGLGPLAAVDAQVVARVDVDNDSFNFWQAPNVRADREYSQGFRLTLLWPSRNALARRLLGGPQQCSAGATSRDCRMLSVALAQAIFTPTLDLRRRTADERPFAGWLGVEVGAQRDRETSLTAVSLMVGVTGPASLGEASQTWVHRTFRFRPPIGWDTQLPAELAFVATYRGARALMRAEQARTGLRLYVAPAWSARLGTVATDATVGLHLTAGLRPPPPWQNAPNSRGDRWGLFARAGASQSAVARNVFLDGSTFGDASGRVPRKPFVGETELGIGVRMPAGTVEWRVHSRSREYERQPKAHAYSTISFAYR